MFIHLRTHSYYSFLRGLPSPTQLATAAAEHGLPAIGLTDRDGLTGAIEFYSACREAGVQPILGLELGVAAPRDLAFKSTGEGAGHRLDWGILAFLAMDLAGWSNLCRLSSQLLSDPDLRGQLPFEGLADKSEGLICLSGGEAGLFARWVREHLDGLAKRWLHQMADLYPGRLYVELDMVDRRDAGMAHQVELARRAGLALVATHPVYYLKPEQAALQRVVSAMRLNTHLEKLPAEAVAPPESSFLPIDQMTARFGELPEALQSSLEIAAHCQLILPLGQPHYPQIHLEGGLTAIQELRRRSYQGALQRYGELTPAVEQRLEHELGVIEAKGYAPLFLIMEKIIAFARQADVPTASRGSASSSLVAHSLGITTPDPLRLNLYFERFLNPARSSPPDIDTDLCSRGRDEVIRFVYQEFGDDRVAMVGTINRFRRRSAIREVAKAYGLPAREISRIIASLPSRGWGPPWMRQSAAVSPFSDLQERYNQPIHREILRDAAALLNFPHHLSIHPGGVVIAPGPLTDLVPTQLSSKGVAITQFDLESVGQLGLIKIDLLGIRGLSVLGDVAYGLSRKSPPPQPSRLAVLDAIPAEDPLTAELVRNGRTMGCFQIESPGMRVTLQEIQADSVDDIMVALALYRPGPLTGGLKDEFVRRHLGREPAAHLHPSLEPLLADTYGVILYQEQVLRIAHELAGLSLAEADLLRRAMSHFDPGKQMQTLKERFVEGATAHAGVPPEVGERVWELMAAFAGYGFPKAHAASYAQVAWRSAWCKAHHPAEFMAAVLANWGGYYRQWDYLAEARRLGLTVRSPHINHSQAQFNVVYLDGQAVLFMGLDQVRDLTRRTQQRILDGRPFHSLADFLERADPRPQEAENLVRAGALRGLGHTPAMLSQLQVGDWHLAGHIPGQMALFRLESEPTSLSEGDDWTPAQIASAQQEVLGVSVDYHPLELVADRLAQQGVTTTLEALTRLGQRVRVAGARQTWRRLSSRAGDNDYAMALEDLEGSLAVFVPGAVYQRYREALSRQRLLVVEGVIEPDPENAEPMLRAERAWPLE